MISFYLVMIALTAPAWGWLGWLPVGALLCLVAGLVLALRRPTRRLLWLALPFIASELFVLLTGLAPASLSSAQASVVLLLFQLVIALAAAAQVWRMQGHRLAAGLLGLRRWGTPWSPLSCPTWC